ncbi:MAG: cupin domain-containing protein [bacterium]|nr:cupin domain-containing protein [bacterium]
MPTPHTRPATINIDDKLAQIGATWTPHIIAELNGQQVKLAKLEGEFTWHDHADEDELFLVLTGRINMQMRDEDGQQHEQIVEPGEIIVIPRGIEHNPIADPGTSVLLFEPAATKHTGDKVLERTVVDQPRI